MIGTPSAVKGSSLFKEGQLGSNFAKGKYPQGEGVDDWNIIVDII